MKVSLITPIYNEESHLIDFLKRIDELELPIEKELVFVDDCSKDTSYDILKVYPFKSKTLIFKHDKNQGKGAALRKGFEVATGEIIGVQDADFEYDMDDLPRILEPFIKGKADIVFGSRYRPENNQVHRTFHYLINQFLTFLSNLFSGLYLSDMETCYKFFKSDILKNINLVSNRFGFEPEITAKVARLKVRILEVPVSYFPRSYMEGKKITWKDGIAALKHILHFNLFSSKKKFFKNEMPEKYIPKGSNWL
jgi:glycosyltransferase involved in cell wall biosynthesis